MGLKDAYSKDVSDIITNSDEFASKAAYARGKLKLTAGGANESKEINITFAQLYARTLYSNSIVSVASGRDETLAPLEPVRWEGNAIATSVSDKGYKEEYVVDQQVSDTTGDRQVVLDAAPLLILPMSTEAASKGTYTANLANVKNLDVWGYDNYQGIEQACVLEGVPGGLNNLNLTFWRLKLSEYSPLVVRAYETGTNRPISDNYGVYAEKIIRPGDFMIDSGTGGVIPVSDVFKLTKSYATVDLKISLNLLGRLLMTVILDIPLLVHLERGKPRMLVFGKQNDYLAA